MSRFRGVSRNGKKWRAEIWSAGVRYYIGTFADEVDAAQAYNEAAIKHHGTSAVLNKFEAKQVKLW